VHYTAKFLACRIENIKATGAPAVDIAQPNPPSSRRALRAQVRSGRQKHDRSGA
jgi:hypothetical protein